jgi:hypothetical protein
MTADYKHGYLRGEVSGNEKRQRAGEVVCPLSGNPIYSSTRNTANRVRNVREKGWMRTMSPRPRLRRLSELNESCAKLTLHGHKISGRPRRERRRSPPRGLTRLVGRGPRPFGNALRHLANSLRVLLGINNRAVWLRSHLPPKPWASFPRCWPCPVWGGRPQGLSYHDPSNVAEASARGKNFLCASGGGWFAVVYGC